MYVCVCNAIRENDLRRAALTCSGDAQSVYAMLGKFPDCGQCLDEADDVLCDARSARCSARFTSPFAISNPHPA